MMSKSARVLAVSTLTALLIAPGVGIAGAAHAAPASGKTGKLVVKVTTHGNPTAHIKLCTFVDGTKTPASKCERSNSNGVARLRHVKAGSIDLISYKPSGKRGYSTYGIHIKAGKVKHYKMELKPTCPGVCG